MAPQTIRLETDARGVARLTLVRPDRHNALDAQMIAELTEAAAQIGEDPAILAVVLTGEGKSFCAGGDLGWMHAQMGMDRATRIAEATKLARMLRALDRIPKPVIGRVNGQAYGGGIGMIAVTDVAVGVESARFGLTEARLGLIPATISPYVMARLGPGQARRMFVAPRLFSGAEAVGLGLLAAAVPAEGLDEAVEREVAPCLSAAPGAMAEAKALARRLSPPIDDAQLALSAEALADRWETAEAEAGIAAFFEKRPPPWVADR